MGKPLVVRCNWCFAILEEPGALVFTPPDPHGQCKKIHVCVGCYARVILLRGATPVVQHAPHCCGDCGESPCAYLPQGGQ